MTVTKIYQQEQIKYYFLKLTNNKNIMQPFMTLDRHNIKHT